jgi:pimeloyl-ACP methyl ester carboxylesterase
VTSSRPVRDIAADAFNACLTDGVRRRELDRGGRRLRWLEAGNGNPPVVFESGAASNSVAWAAVFVALAPDHRVIAYDRVHADRPDLVTRLVRDIAARLAG